MPANALEIGMELRCNTLHGIVKLHHGIKCLEIKCHHPKCTKGRAVTMFHYYSLKTGDLVDTVTYQDPGRRFKR